MFSLRGQIGQSPQATNSAVTVTGSGSFWNNSAELRIGVQGDGRRLTIADGGAVSNTYGYVGYDATANNHAVTVAGAGSVWHNSDKLYVGYDGSGSRFAISNGGAVTVGADAIVGHGAARSNVIELADGTLTLSNGTGTLHLRYGALTGVGTVHGNVGCGSGSLLAPGNSIGTLTIDGNLSLTNGLRLQFELQSPVHGDRIVASNTLFFANMETNWFAFSADGTLQPGDYVLFDAGLLAGSLGVATNFDSVGASGKAGHLWLDGINNNVMLSVVPEPGSLALAESAGACSG